MPDGCQFSAEFNFRGEFDDPAGGEKKMHSKLTPVSVLKSTAAIILIFLLGLQVLPQGLTHAAEKKAITKKVIKSAEKLFGLEFTNEERELMLEDANDLLEAYAQIREATIGNEVAPALLFDPTIVKSALNRRPGPSIRSHVTPPAVPDNLEDLAFLPVTHLASLIESRKITSTQLTKMYLGRLKRLGPKLECVITLTEELALKQAARADEEIAAGHYRGPLHGIPWGAKDLLSVKGYKTTWGAMPFKDQVIDQDAAVVQKLEEAGAVLVAKLTLGALAWGDVWYGGKTRNPWNLEQGSSGSSAGSASATAAGLVGFAIGSETLGSIVSPSTRCGTTGLRPTFGRVSRHGAMALSWSMDKLGPLCRSVEDCALVLEAIHGPGGDDASALKVPFNWNADLDPTRLRVGYVKAAFETEIEEDDEQAMEGRKHDLASLDALTKAGFELIPIEIPEVPVNALLLTLSVESAAAFDEFTRSGQDDLLVRQIRFAWPNNFRTARLIPGVEYVQANRLRTQVMHQMAALMETVDVYVAPSFGGSNLVTTNLTGHPAVVLPNGFREDGTPTSITFTGKLFGETELLAVARAYQEATDFHLKHPSLEDEGS
jgi:Asp-tRNA(Asn)/Glu-tRNA(Gln) amidotransferase A subunit family amidase